MARNLTSRAVVLKNSRIGDIHKGVWLFTENYGIINAIAHGAYKAKGKLTGVTDPFSFLICYLYHDPVKNSYKISDVICKNQFETIRSDLTRFYYCSLWAEVLLKSFGGGEETKQLFRLLVPSLSLLNGVPASRTQFVLIQFLWRFVGIVGYRPSLEKCERCGGVIETEKPAYYYRNENILVCSHCADVHMTVLSPGGQSYLAYTESRPIKDAVKVTVDDTTYRELLDIVTAMVSEIVESPLNTLRTGEDFF